jgi:rhodanese-related sulfurtransferase
MELNFCTNDPHEANRYFKAKARFSTGPGEVNYALEHGRRVGVDFTIIDVRHAEDFAKGHIPGAVNLPEGKWESFAGLAKDKQNLIYCYSPECHLAARAAVDFTDAGFSVMEIDGGFQAWSEDYELDVEVSPSSTPLVGLARADGPPKNENDGRFSVESLL